MVESFESTRVKNFEAQLAELRSLNAEREKILTQLTVLKNS